MKAIQIIACSILLLGSFTSFGQTSYIDKGSGPAAGLKAAARVMELLSENDLEDIWNYCVPGMRVDTPALESAAAQIADDYQASEGRESVIDLKETPNSTYERTFYQASGNGPVTYLMQVRLTVTMQGGNPLVNNIRVVTGPSIRKYDKLIRSGQDEPTAPEARPERKPRKQAEEEDE